MKKSISFVIIVVILVCTFWFSTSHAAAAGTITFAEAHFVSGKGIAFVFEASGFRTKDLKGASIYVGSNFHDLFCSANKKEGRIICVARGVLTRYAHQTGIIHLAGQKFYVIIPVLKQNQEPQGPAMLTCEGEEVLGAMVTFDAGEGDPQSHFLAGQTLNDVKNLASDWLEISANFYSNPKIADLQCGVPTFPGFFEQ